MSVSTIAIGITIVLCLVIISIVNRADGTPSILSFTPKMENARPWGILFYVPTIIDFRMRISSVDWKVRYSDWSLFSIRSIESEFNPTRHQEGKRQGIREGYAILLQGGC